MTREIIENRSTLLFQIGLTLFLSVSFIQSTFDILNTLYVNVPILLGTIFFSFPIWIKKVNRNLVILGFLLLIHAILWGRYTERLWFTHKAPYYSLLAISTGIMFIRTKLSRWIFLIPIGVISLIVVVGISVFHEIPVSGSYFFSINRNRLAISIIIYAMLYGIWEIINLNGRVGIIIPLLALLIAAYSQSRAGLLISILYVLSVSVSSAYPKLRELRMHKQKNDSKTRLKAIIVVAALIGILVISMVAILNSRLMKYGLDSNGRITIYQNYFEHLSFSRLLFGYQPPVLEVRSSLHNSFLELLADTGLIIALAVFFLIAVLWFKLKQKSGILSIMLLIILLYAQVEHIIFMGLGDFILLPLLVYAIEGEKVVPSDQLLLSMESFFSYSTDKGSEDNEV